MDLLPTDLKNAIQKIDKSVLSKINEIRIRRDRAVILVIKGNSYFLFDNGELSSTLNDNPVLVNSSDFDDTFYAMCDYSIYSNSTNLKQGYITLKNGARVGIASTAVYEDNSIVSVNSVMSLNIRIPSQALGCSLEILNFMFHQNLHSVIVAGPPSSGKTTLLRDMAYNLSNGFCDKYRRVVLVDERNEFAGKRESEYTLDVGENCDVLTGFEKAKGIELAIRTLSPEIIVCDELSKNEELERIKFGFSCGVKFLLSVHIGDRKDIFNKPIINSLINTNEFEYVILLDGHTYSANVIDIGEVKNEINRRNSYGSFERNDGNCFF